MLSWHRRPYLIDHGATLTFAHNWSGAANWIARPYDAKEHAVRGCSPELAAADAALAGRIDEAVVTAAAAQVPDEWLVDADEHGGLAQLRAAYAAQILGRLEARDQWLPALIASLA
jgi:hypothetical protein